MQVVDSLRQGEQVSQYVSLGHTQPSVQSDKTGRSDNYAGHLSILVKKSHH